MKLRLSYVFPGQNEPVDSTLGVLDFDQVGMVAWLHWMVESNPDTIFFFTTDTTDIWSDNMTDDEFMVKVLEAFPKAMVGTDNDGQLVVYTNLRLNEDGTVVELDQPNTTGV